MACWLEMCGTQNPATISARGQLFRTKGRYLSATSRLLAGGGDAQACGGPNGPANGSCRHWRASSEAQAAEHARGRKIYVQIFIERGPSKAANGSSLLTS